MRKASTVGIATSLLAMYFLAVGDCQQSPPNPKIVFEEAQRALNAHDYAKAEQGFRDVIKIDPHSAAAYADLGVVYMRRSEYKRAIDAFKNAKKIAPEVAGIDLNLGLAYYHQNDFAAAIPPFTRVLHADPDQAQARYLLGMSYFLTNDFEHTVKTLEPPRGQSRDEFGFLICAGDCVWKAQAHRRIHPGLRAIGARWR